MAKGEGVFACCFLLLLIVCIVATNLRGGGAAEAAQVTVFIFGDSTVDVGTNNLLNGTSALANFPYYGIDFPGSIPTGRFSNGFNLADQLAGLFGHDKSPQPYLYLVKNESLFREEILKGVNFASGGSGILEHTGKKLWGRIVPLKEQIQQFEAVRGNISSDLNDPKEAAKLLSNALYIFSVGSNDILDPIRLGTNLTDKLLCDLRSSYRQHLENLYNMGARKFGIIAAAPIGCCPFSRALNKSMGGAGGCLREPNDFARAFYKAIDTLLCTMSSEFPDMKYSLANSYKMTQYVLKHPYLGFNETKKACCGSGYDNGEGGCNKTQNPNLCKNRNKYLFWDLYHPSQAATALSAITLYNGNLDFIKPMNFSLLAQLQL
ncbi:GDSL esterase/lipase At5g45670 [Manihot esculenta]|uniref:GDSL esterase/lipase n=1 Tax=Manihot esculenta TaxID=3983 RepID=A0A2C9WCX6_MANES|nr:GDSL esterase/lipase At5g45670 [Manihot esculenta]OAY57626.1 hypothetical protein MANES_02G111500v8 [Manihot esculenta]